MIIGLAGKLHSGKGTVSEYLVKKYRFKRIGFADSFKNIARNIGWNGIKDEDGRKLLQNLGSAIRLHLGPDTLIEVVERQISDGSNWVVDDVRMSREADRLKKLGAVLVKIERPDYVRTGDIYQHITETDLDDYHFDIVLTNDGTPQDLKHRVDQLLGKLEFS